MATIYNFKAKCVSAFICLPEKEISDIIKKALEQYRHRSGLRLESIEVERLNNE